MYSGGIQVANQLTRLLGLGTRSYPIDRVILIPFGIFALILGDALTHPAFRSVVQSASEKSRTRRMALVVTRRT